MSKSQDTGDRGQYQSGTTTAREASADYLYGWQCGWEAGWQAALQHKHTQQEHREPVGKDQSDVKCTIYKGAAWQAALKRKPNQREQMEPARRDRSDVKCTICKNFHREARYDCPQIPDILAQKISLPNDICTLCLSLCDSNGWCTNTRKPCHELPGRKGLLSLLCPLHQPRIHFQLCFLCPLNQPRSLGHHKSHFIRKSSTARGEATSDN